MRVWPGLLGRLGRSRRPTPSAVPPGPPLPERVAPDDPYRAYTRAFDCEVAARDLDAVLGPLDASQRDQMDATWRAYVGGWPEGPGGPDGAALDDAILRTAEALRSALPPEVLADSVVTLLIDHSGSMRGRPIALAAAAAEVAVEALELAGVRVEVLGFTTVGWKGGRARRLWLRRGRPAAPGRLCDLLHVIHRSADDRGPFAVHPMLSPGLLHENVDGEALEWAARRLADRPERRRVLAVLSDGAPVDDSTLAANGTRYLEDHLRAVIAGLEEDPGLALMAIGIGHDVGRYYRTSRTVRSADDLPLTLLDLLRDGLLGGGPPDRAPQAPLIWPSGDRAPI